MRARRLDTLLETLYLTVNRQYGRRGLQQELGLVPGNAAHAHREDATWPGATVEPAADASDDDAAGGCVSDDVSDDADAEASPDAPEVLGLEADATVRVVDAAAEHASASAALRRAWAALGAVLPTAEAAGVFAMKAAAGKLRRAREEVLSLAASIPPADGAVLPMLTVAAEKADERSRVRKRARDEPAQPKTKLAEFSSAKADKAAAKRRKKWNAADKAAKLDSEQRIADNAAAGAYPAPAPRARGAAGQTRARSGAADKRSV